MRSLDHGAEHSDCPHLSDRDSKLRSLEVIGDKLVELGYESGTSLAELRPTIAAGEPDQPLSVRPLPTGTD